MFRQKLMAVFTSMSISSGSEAVCPAGPVSFTSPAARA